MGKPILLCQIRTQSTQTGILSLIGWKQIGDIYTVGCIILFIKDLELLKGPLFGKQTLA